MTGEDGKAHGTIWEYWNLAPGEGLAKAQAYLSSAKRGQDGSGSDWAYWAYEGDIALAAVLVALFKRLSTGREDLPPLPEVDGRILMDKTSLLQDWAARCKE